MLRLVGSPWLEVEKDAKRPRAQRRGTAHPLTERRCARGVAQALALAPHGIAEGDQTLV
jgi:hypothetical protein